MGKEEEELVLLTRACDQHSVVVCPGVLGRQLYTGLKDAAVGAGGALREAGGNLTMRNRLALGVAGGYWGGRTAASAEAWALTAADFPGATTQQLDEFFVPGDDTMEPKPRPPVTWGDWLRRTRRSANIWSLVYGDEWRAPLSKCLADLEAMHEDHPMVFPKDVIMDLWEELN